MDFLKMPWKTLVELLRILLYGWLLALIRIITGWCRLLKLWHAKSKLPEHEQNTAASPCVPLHAPAFLHPDPLIYSQYYLMSLGLAVTWDNPDIRLFKGGVYVPSESLERNTEYEIVARIWNGSTDAPIQSLPVHFSVLSFGIGTRSDPLPDTAVNLGVIGGANHPAFARTKWRTPDAPGHYCLQVFFSWMDDTNPFNNLGQENTNVGTLHSPAVFDFVLRNATADRQTYRFEADSYAIPPPLPCRPSRDTPETGQGPYGDYRARHNRANYPLPAGWSVTILPERVELDAATERQVQVRVEAPGTFRGRAPVNVNAFYGDGKLAGGVTLYVERS